MSYAPHTLDEVFAWYRAQQTHPSANWHGMCQSSVRTAWGLPGGFASAWLQWLGLDAEDRHAGGKPEDAPRGAALFYKGSSPYGHITTASAPFKNGAAACWSNDLKRDGDLDPVARTAATTKWGQTYLGYGTSVNGYDLNLAAAKTSPKTTTPRPKQDKPYKMIDVAVHNLEGSLATARMQHDAADVAAINTEIKRLKAAYAKLRRA